jgi:hypothetical protein
VDSALQSLYGDGHVNATRTRECVAMPGVRDQRVYTPDYICERLIKVWDIEYDAAAGPDSLVPARRSTETRGLIDPWPLQTYCNPPYGESLFDPETQMEHYLRELAIREEHKANCKRTGKKTAIKWPAGFRPLKKAGLKNWFAMHMKATEAIVLVPVRTHRKWFREWWLSCNAVVALDPVTFTGMKQAAPFPCCLGYRGAHEERFAASFCDIGSRLR